MSDKFYRVIDGDLSLFKTPITYSQSSLASHWGWLGGERDVYMGTLSTFLHPPADTAASELPWMSIRFNGTAVRIVGRPTEGLGMDYSIVSQPPGVAPQSMPELLDARLNFTWGSSLIGKNGVTIFSLDNLAPDLEHTLTLYPYANQFHFDYVSILPPPSSLDPSGFPLLPPPLPTDVYTIYDDPEVPLPPPQLLSQVDDDHPGIRYLPEGAWRKEVPELRTPADEGSPDAPGVVAPFAPTGRGWTSTTQVGASFEFDFVGDQISGYGPAYQRQVPDGESNLVVEYSLLYRNGTQATTPVRSSVNKPHEFDDPEQQQSWKFDAPFSLDAPDDSDRNREWTLRVVISEGGAGQTYYLDYLTFGSESVPLPPLKEAGSGNLDPFPKPAVIGGVIGALIAGFIGIAAVYHLRRRRKKKANRLRHRRVVHPNQNGLPIALHEFDSRPGYPDVEDVPPPEYSAEAPPPPMPEPDQPIIEAESPPSLTPTIPTQDDPQSTPPEQELPPAPAYQPQPSPTPSRPHTPSFQRYTEADVALPASPVEESAMERAQVHSESRRNSVDSEESSYTGSVRATRGSMERRPSIEDPFPFPAP